MVNINRLLLSVIIFALPEQSVAAINTFYDLKLEIQKIKDAIANSNIYGIILYSGGAVVVFIVAIIAIFLLIMLLRK